MPIAQRHGRISSATRLGVAALALIAALFAGCTVYAPETRDYVAAPPPTASAFERSWAAAVGALGDEGVRITAEERDSGLVHGSRNEIDVTANVRSRVDGSVRVEFNTSGATSRDPALIERVSRAYDRRMGR